MSDLHDAFDRAVKTSIHKNEPRGTVGTLDSATGAISYAVPGYPQHIWVMVEQGMAKTPTHVLNRDCPHIYGLPIVIRTNADGNPEAWIDSYRAAAFLGPNGPPLGVAFHSHRWGTGLEDIVEGERLQPGMIHTKSGLTVTVEGFYYDNGSGTQEYFPTTDVDLTAFLPTTAGYFAWLKIGWVQSTGAVVVVTSTEKSLKSDLTPALLAATALTSSARPLGGVKVQTNQTTITNQGDIADGREWFGEAGGGSVSFDTPTVTLSNVAAQGSAPTALRSDCTLVAFDATAPSNQAFGDSAAVGTAAFAARRDHKHGMPGSPSAVNDFTVTAGENLAARDVCYVKASDGLAYKLDTDATAAVKVGAIRGIVTAAINTGNSGSLRRIGTLGGFTGLTAWASVYASTTAGGYTQTKPTVSDGGSQVCQTEIGFAISTTEVFILPKNALFLKRKTLTNGAALTVEHYADASPRSRQIRAYQTITGTGAVAEYDSSHYDTDVQLRGQSGAGATTTVDTANGTPHGMGNQSGGYYANAQSFQVTAGILSQFTVSFGANNGSPTGTVTWKVCADNSNAPGTVLSTGTFTPTPSANNTINVTGGAFLAASTKYWLMLYSTGTQSLDVYWRVNFNAAAPYANGNYAWAPSPYTSWTQSTGEDMTCTITTSAVTAYDKLAQSFQLSAGSTISAAALYLKKVGSPTGTMTLRLETDSSGPSGTLADANATATVAESGLSTSLGSITFTFAGTFALSASTTYWLVLSTDRAASNTNYVIWGIDASSPSYTSGQWATCVSSTWTPDANRDGVFSVTGSLVPYDEPLVIGRVSGGTRDVGVQMDDGSAGHANGDTNTTFVNEATTMDITVLVELSP